MEWGFLVLRLKESLKETAPLSEVWHCICALLQHRCLSCFLQRDPKIEYMHLPNLAYVNAAQSFFFFLSLEKIFHKKTVSNQRDMITFRASWARLPQDEEELQQSWVQTLRLPIHCLSTVLLCLVRNFLHSHATYCDAVSHFSLH